jgi:phospholipase C
LGATVLDDLDITRRGFLKTGAVLGAAGLASDALGGPLLESASARARQTRARFQDVEHIVVLMQENRSFDEFLGTFPGVRGFDDKRNRQAFAQPGYNGPGARSGHLLPFHVDGRSPVGQCLGDIDRPNHDWAPQHLSWNHGRNNHFYKVHAETAWDGAFGVNVMGYLDKPDIPYFWALARAYTVCDMYFCSVIGPTEPNRVYSISATLDPAGRHGGPCVETVFNGAGLAGNFTWTTMPEQLRARGISWKSYTQAPSGQLDSPFPAFTRFHTDPTLNRFGIQPTYPADFHADLARDELPPCPGSRSPSRSPSTPAMRPPWASSPSTRCCGRSGATPRSGARPRSSSATTRMAASSTTSGRPRRPRAPRASTSQ